MMVEHAEAKPHLGLASGHMRLAAAHCLRILRELFLHDTTTDLSLHIK